ncbi:ATP-dependent helicase [Patescibacteria group bacterium]|nr:ATP-dependent helicase [Patescibacteria group bacterium]MBU1673494.1 ATP-dependent helicase [Patescibacteria group bacterium]MBU1963760.1 ATP-dependent helicase [Patescibacteria group bacterium]
MKDVLEGLNPEQKKAVVHEGGPLLIVAGAGTGKTTVVTRRIAWLINDKKVPADQILSMTFTDKAAGEIEERVEAMLPLGYFDMWISTFHSFGERILKEHALDIGLPTNFKLLSETEQWLLIRENLDEFELDYYKPKANPTKFIQALVKHFSRVKDENITPEEYIKFAESKKQDKDAMMNDEGEKDEAQRLMEIASAYAMYQKILLDNSALDFGDLITYTIKLFKERPAILKKYQEQFKYFLVDEFQDTNYAQYDLIKMLALPDNNLTVVGDDDQSIYKFRGASVSNIMEFKKDYKGCEEVVLVDNYRSGQKILDLSHEFIQQNDPDRLEAKLRIDKNLIAKAVEKSEIEYIPFNTQEEEARGVVQKILELKNKNNNWNDFAILIRANSQADQFMPYMDRAEMPYQFLASKGLFSKPIIIDLISYLRLLDNYHESRALFRVLNLKVFDINYETILQLLNYGNKFTLSLWEATLNARTVSKIDEKEIAKVEKVVALIEEGTNLAREKSVGQILLKFLEKSGYLKEITKQEGRETEEKMLYLNQFYKYIEKFEKGTDDKSVQNFVQEMDLVQEAGEEGNLRPDFDEGPDKVKIMTVHGAKGLEYKYVFIVNLVDKRFPSIKRNDPILVPEELIKETLPEGDVHLQEERRLFYVAMTRAKQGLFLTSAENYGGKRKKKPSRFLVETKMVPGPEPKPTGKVIFGSRKHEETKSAKHEGPEKREINKNQKFSFTQLKAFETCPWQYRFGHVLRIPTPGKPSFSFGKTMHATMHKFFLEFTRRGEGQADLFNSGDKKETNAPSLKRLLEIYENEWIGEWYKDKWQEKEYRGKGKKALQEFYKKHENNWPKIKYLEKPINFKLGEYTLKGVIDRIDDDFSVVDYKTGKFPKTKKGGEQLLLYALGIEQTLDKLPKTLNFYYLEDNQEMEIDMDEKKLEKVEKWALDLIVGIMTTDYKATPGFDCKFCDYASICEFRKK